MLDNLKDHTMKELLWINILKLLTERDFYGYEIKKKLSDKFNIDSALITSYVTLYRLEKEKYVSSYWNNGRKFYRITKSGLFLLDMSNKFLDGYVKNTTPAVNDVLNWSKILLEVDEE